MASSPNSCTRQQLLALTPCLSLWNILFFSGKNGTKSAQRTYQIWCDAPRNSSEAATPSVVVEGDAPEGFSEKTLSGHGYTFTGSATTQLRVTEIERLLASSLHPGLQGTPYMREFSLIHSRDSLSMLLGREQSDAMGQLLSKLQTAGNVRGYLQSFIHVPIPIQSYSQ